MQTLIDKIDEIKQHGTFRTLEIPVGFDFSSNDYLGFSHNLNIKKKLADFLLSPNTELGSTGSRLISGQNIYYVETEKFISELFTSESALIFGSGYLANLGVMLALGGSEAEFFSDELNHASIIDGIKLSRTQVNIFKHNDLSHLENLLKKSNVKRKIIVTESIFSMDGDSANIKALVELAEKFDAFLVLDEAHATGIKGELGLGESKRFHKKYEKLISVHTCSKALGTYGAFVISNKLIRDLMINCSRSFIYSTGLPPVIVLNIRYSLEELLNNYHLVETINENSHWFKQKLNLSSLNNNSSNIVPIIVGNEKKVMQVASHMKEKGFHVRGIRYPTVAKGSERLRVTIKAFHTKELISTFINHLIESLNE